MSPTTGKKNNKTKKSNLYSAINEIQEEVQKDFSFLHGHPPNRNPMRRRKTGGERNLKIQNKKNTDTPEMSRNKLALSWELQLYQEVLAGRTPPDTETTRLGRSAENTALRK